MKNVESEKGIGEILEAKLALFKQYLSVTERMKTALSSREAGHLSDLIGRRQTLIRQIEKIDGAIKRAVSGGLDSRYPAGEKIRGLVDSYAESIRKIMETVASLDRELTATVKKEGEQIKTDLLRGRRVRQAVKGYGGGAAKHPRFLDVRR